MEIVCCRVDLVMNWPNVSVLQTTYDTTGRLPTILRMVIPARYSTV